MFTRAAFEQLLERALNAILYSTSAGITFESRRASPQHDRLRSPADAQ